MAHELINSVGFIVNAEAIHDCGARFVEAQHFNLGALAAELDDHLVQRCNGGDIPEVSAVQVDGYLVGVLGIFRPKTTKCSGGPAVCGLQRGITFFEIPIWALFE